MVLNITGSNIDSFSTKSVQVQTKGGEAKTNICNNIKELLEKIKSGDERPKMANFQVHQGDSKVYLIGNRISDGKVVFYSIHEGEEENLLNYPIQDIPEDDKSLDLLSSKLMHLICRELKNKNSLLIDNGDIVNLLKLLSTASPTKEAAGDITQERQTPTKPPEREQKDASDDDSGDDDGAGGCCCCLLTGSIGCSSIVGLIMATAILFNGCGNARPELENKDEPEKPFNLMVHEPSVKITK